MGGLTLSGWSCGQAPKSRPALLPTFSYAAASSKQASDLPGGMQRATLLGNANGPTACAGTERDNEMLGRQLFGAGATTTPEYWIDGRRIRAAGKAPSRIPSAVR